MENSLQRNFISRGLPSLKLSLKGQFATLTDSMSQLYSGQAMKLTIQGRVLYSRDISKKMLHPLFEEYSKMHMFL